jgi:hypothetical protein
MTAPTLGVAGNAPFHTRSSASRTWTVLVTRDRAVLTTPCWLRVYCEIGVLRVASADGCRPKLAKGRRSWG